MAITLTPKKARFFLYAAFTKPGQEQQPPLLQTLLALPISPSLRFRLNVLRRNLEAALAPFDAQARSLWEAYEATITDEDATPDDAAQAPEEKKPKPKPEPKAEPKAEDKADKAEAKKKLDEDLDELDNTEFQFTGKLVLSSQLDDMPPAAADFFSVPGVMEEWFQPFVIDD
jgi:hypothetical protein